MKINLIILIITCMDVLTALLLLFSPIPLVVARLGIFYKLFPNSQIGGSVFMLSSLLALYGIFFIPSGIKRFLFFTPQLLLFLLKTSSVILYVYFNQYPDGVNRSWQFILLDQLPIIFLTITYLFSIVDIKKNG